MCLLVHVAFLMLPPAASSGESQRSQTPPPPLLSPLYHQQCRRPCEYVGFSFDDTPDEMRQMIEHGANACGSGAMWVPADDPEAPHGAGIGDLSRFTDVRQFGQSFTVDQPITAVALCTPTFLTEGSGCTLSLYHAPPDGWAGREPEPVASQAFTDVRDNQRLWLTFAEQPVASYYLEQSQPTGSAIGVWAVGRDTYLGGHAYLNREPMPHDDLELLYRAADGERELIAPVPDHHSIRLGLSRHGQMAEMGMHFAYSVGNWNNGGFPYYPDWFIERFPDMAMLDQAGNPIMAGMFDRLAPWPSIDHPVIADGTRRYIRAIVERLRDNPNLLFWTMGGEPLYATYLMPNRWTDYGNNAIAHYQAWLKLKYGTVEKLNRAWGTAHQSFSEIEPPRQPARDLPTLDWFRYRNRAMADRFQWHFAETKGADPDRLVMTCNHGNIFHGMAGTWLGQDMALYAGVSDGWEMGQIMSDEDADLYNLMWMRAAGTFGKPLCPVRLAYKKTDPRARGGGTSYTPEAARRYFWESVGTGAWHMGFIQWRGSLPDGEWGVKGTPAQQAIADIFSEWHEIEPYFDDAWPVKEPVGLYLSQLRWALDGFSPLWTRLHKELTQRQIGYRILCDEQVTSGELDTVSVLISADNRLMSSGCVAALRAFAPSGGTLVLMGDNASEDEHLRPRRRPFRDSDCIRLDAASAGPIDDLEELIDHRQARLLRLRASSEEPYLGRTVIEVAPHHDTPFDLWGHESLGQTFRCEAGRLSSVSVSNPTYTKTVTDHSLTIHVLADEPGGELIAEKTFPAEELTDNAWHEVTIDPPAPPGIYYVRLLTPAGLPEQLLGVWGTAGDSYPGGTRHVDDTPVEGDLKLKVTCEVEKPARAAVEAFPLSDGLNAIVLLANIADIDLQAQVDVSPELLSPLADRYTVRNLATGNDLGTAPRDAVSVRAAVPGHRTAVLYIAAEVDEQTARSRVAALRERVAQWPAEANAAHRAHLARAQQALAEGRHAKALASVLRAEARVPALLTADLRGDRLAITATCAGDGAPGIGPLTARLVPLPGKTLALPRSGRPGEYTAAVPLSDLGVRYDYESQEYVPYFGALEVIVTSEVGERTVAASCVVEIARR